MALTGSSISGNNRTLTGDFYAGGHSRANLHEDGAGNASVELTDLGSNVGNMIAKTNGIDSTALNFQTSIGSTAGIEIWPKGGIRFVPQQAQNSCNAATNVLVWKSVSAVGVPDTVKICLQKTDNSYSLVTIATAP